MNRISTRLRLLLAAIAVIVSGGLSFAADTAGDATHRQATVIHPAPKESGQKLVSFCLAANGRIVALVASGSGANPAELAEAPSPVTLAAAEKQTKARCEVRILSGEGKLLENWPVDFTAQAVNVGPDGHIYLGGDGVLARYDQQGQQLARAEAPHAVAARNDAQTLEEKAREILAGQADAFAAEVKRLEEQKKELTDKDAKALTNDEKALLAQVNELIPVYQRAAESQKNAKVSEEQVKRTAQHLAQRQRTINAIAASDTHVYITCAAAKGFGYAVWRTDRDFQQPQMTITGLSGCCGQMDVQCCGSDLFVAENSRHRVVRYDADGKKLAAWGMRDRDGNGKNFGGCCNPMNTRLVGGKLYVSESDGRVKLFTPAGEYQGLVGKAAVQPGCKSSIVDVAADGETVYYFDVQNSAICVLKRAEG